MEYDFATTRRGGGHRGCWLASCALVVALIAAAGAQQPASNASPPGKPPAPDQQPGQGAELHTGTASGLTLDARLQNLLADHQYARVATELDSLPPDQAQLYRGVLDNRTNHLNASIEILEPLVDEVVKSGDTAKEK